MVSAPRGIPWNCRMAAIKRTKREKYMFQQWQLLHLLFWVHPAAERITVKVNHRGYQAKGLDQTGKKLFDYKRAGDPQRYIDNPFRLFRDHLTPARLDDPAFGEGDIVSLFLDSEFYRHIIDCTIDPDIGLYAHTLDMLMQEAATELYDLCLAHRGQKRRPRIKVVFLGGRRSSPHHPFGFATSP